MVKSRTGSADGAARGSTDTVPAVAARGEPKGVVESSVSDPDTYSSSSKKDYSSSTASVQHPRAKRREVRSRSPSAEQLADKERIRQLSEQVAHLEAKRDEIAQQKSSIEEENYKLTQDLQKLSGAGDGASSGPDWAGGGDGIQ